MMVHEFCKVAGIPAIAEEEWEIIHTVYQFHPLIPEVGGQEKIATLWKLGGIGLMRDMLSAARRGEVLEDEIQQARRKIEEARAELNEVIVARRRFLEGYGVSPNGKEGEG